ncbi:hypothetical protein GCM10023185_44880 [Hymenobacter saemangeumensis]|uniref:N-acetyltransferase domain-containing protein n=1 Tax=Hymenobacter saemangeumensis TaxID=1084522 RepID=A0ABP8ISF0_9BACT
MGGKLEKLPWDSQWLGLPVARYVADAGTMAEAQAAAKEAREGGIRLLYLVMPPHSREEVSGIQALGARLLDEKLSYVMALVAERPVELPHGLVLQKVKAPVSPLEELAIQSGAYSRFRLDARIGPAAFEALYRRWLHQSVEKGDVWTIQSAGKELGLLALGQRGTMLSIELLAVAPPARRRRLGRLLVACAAREARQQGLDGLQVVTQGANEPARRLYESCGFELARTEYVYHWWL